MEIPPPLRGIGCEQPLLQRDKGILGVSRGGRRLIFLTMPEILEKVLDVYHREPFFSAYEHGEDLQILPSTVRVGSYVTLTVVAELEMLNASQIVIQ